MKHRRKRLEMLGLVLLTVLGAMAFSASAAQAEGEFRIGSKKFSELEAEKTKGIEEESITGSLVKEFNYVMEDGNMAIKCEKLEVVNGKLLLKGIGDTTVLFKECALYQYKDLLKLNACGVEEMLLKVLSLVVTSGGKPYLLFEPFPGEKFLLTFKFTKEICPFGEIGLGVGGSFVGRLLPSEKIEQELFLDGNQEVEEKLGDGLKFGVHKASISGALSLSLSGFFKGSAWEAVG
jgi:hypothetical protein